MSDPPTSPLTTVARWLVARQRDGVVVQDAEGRIVDFNDAALDVLSLTADQLTGRSSLDPHWQALTPDGAPLPGDRHPAMVALATGEEQLGVVMGVRDGRGNQRWLSVDSYLLPDPDAPEDEAGPLVVTQFSDVTDRLEAEARVRDALHSIQRLALPQGRLDVPWIDAAMRYESVTPALEIGGDFVDVFLIDDDRCGFFVGDVSGHDFEAAAVMLLVRHTLRATAVLVDRPSRALSWLHDSLAVARSTAFSSAVLGIATRSDRGVEVVVANAGHPAPIHVVPGGASPLDERGAILGVLDDYRPPPDVTCALAPGEQLVLYTDGLLESALPRLTDGDLVDVLRRSVNAVDVVDAMMERARADDLAAQDDIAALVLTAT